MSSTGKKNKVKAAVENDAKKLGHDVKTAGKDLKSGVGKLKRKK